MFELNIGIDKANINYLHYIKDTVQKTDIKTYIALNEEDARLSIACEEVYKEKLVKKINRCICDIIMFLYKENYFKQNLNTQNLNLVLKNALLKALILFDFETDKSLILKELKYNNSFNINSFYTFKLTHLKRKWQEVVTLANQNSCYFFECESFLDLLKFLIAAIEPKRTEVNVHFNGKNFLLLDEHNKKIKITQLAETNNNELDLITMLIIIAPNRINFHCTNSISNNTFKILYYIFDKNVNLCL